jgi:peptide/nickel transport system permease protein
MSEAVETTLDAAAAADAVRARGPWSQAFRRFRRQKLGIGALAVLIVIFGAGALAGVIAPYAYNQIDIKTALGGSAHGPTLSHLFGTDDAGKDLLSQILYGIRTSVEVALSVAAAATLVGIVIGAFAG